MRQLDSCDFCGEDAEGVFEVVPGSAAGGSRRLALCASCRETLQSVVDPLLDAAGTGTPASGNHTSGDHEGAADSPDDESDPRGASDTPASVPEAEPDSTVDPVDETDEGSGKAPDSDSSGDGGSGDTASGGEQDDDGVTIQSGSSSGSTGERRPAGYAQVLRLLQNRDGAMSRSDLRTLATNAYDLREQDFEDAVDAAVENGDAEETGDGLRAT